MLPQHIAAWREPDPEFENFEAIELPPVEDEIDTTLRRHMAAASDSLRQQVLDRWTKELANPALPRVDLGAAFLASLRSPEAMDRFLRDIALAGGLNEAILRRLARAFRTGRGRASDRQYRSRRRDDFQIERALLAALEQGSNPNLRAALIERWEEALRRLNSTALCVFAFRYTDLLTVPATARAMNLSLSEVKEISTVTRSTIRRVVGLR